jgi:hypothetical protein
MLNERREAEELLKNKKNKKECDYRELMILSKYFKEIGVKHVECRNEIFKWAKTNSINIKDNLTSIVAKVFSKDLKLFEGEVKIFKEDIDMINRCSGYIKGVHKERHKYNVRLLMFAFLAYHKMNKDDRSVCKISIYGISGWTGIAKNHIHSRYMKDIYNSGFMIKETKDNEMIKLKTLRRDFKMVSRNNEFFIDYPKYEDEDNFFIFKDNNIKEEFDSVNKYFE